MGTVMVAGYDMAMYYDINGKPYLFSDILKLAKNWANESIINEILKQTKDDSEFNRLLVSKYLASRQQVEPKLQASEFNPTDNALVTFTSIFNLRGLNADEVEWEQIQKPWDEDLNKPENERRYNTVLKIFTLKTQ